jgi:hypothetical protein
MPVPAALHIDVSDIAAPIMEAMQQKPTRKTSIESRE